MMSIIQSGFEETEGTEKKANESYGHIKVKCCCRGNCCYRDGIIPKHQDFGREWRLLQDVGADLLYLHCCQSYS